jgi:2-(1,2-epoxy-1,2-dihydrophenyl)acetyl-CoA isomerase
VSEVASEREVLDYEVRAGVAWLTMNRPQARNAINARLRAALAAAVRRAERDGEVRAVVLTGAEGAFCSGADVRELRGPDRSIEAIRGEYERILLGIYSMPKPVIAAVNGVAAGIGASIALCCDLRYAVPSASFVEAFVRIGLTVDGGSSWLLPRLIGRGRALEMCLTGDPLAAEEAERLGLVNRVVAPERLTAEVGKIAERLAAGPAAALGAIKRSFNHSVAASFEEALDFEFLLQGPLLASEEFERRVSAFLDRRRGE